LLAAVLAVATAFAACGGSSDSSTSGGGGSTADAQKVLDETFNPDSQIHSADIDVTLGFKASGSQDSDLSAELSGPVDGSGSGVPKFDLTAKVSGSGGGQSIDFEGGATSTGDAAYVTYNGDSYKVDDQTFSYLKQSFDSAQNQNTQQQSDLSAFKDVLTNVTNEGTEDVEGTSTVHVSGDVDVKKLVAAIKPLAEQAQALGSVSGGQVPSSAQLDQVAQYISGATFDVYSGESDHLLRRLTAHVDIDDPNSDNTASIDFDVTLGGVNESQDVSAPDNAKPLSDLIGPGGLGGLLGGAGLGTGSSGGTTTPGISPSQASCLQSATTQQQIQACLTQ
jgi:hypothetical protein